MIYEAFFILVSVFLHALRGRGGLYIVRPSHSATARMAKSVDAGDLKSLARKGVPVRVRLRAPSSVPGYSYKPLSEPAFLVGFVLYDYLLLLFSILIDALVRPGLPVGGYFARAMSAAASRSD